MLKNYLRIALRNLRRHRSYALINVFGLALSMSVCMLIILLIQDQLSYDRFHKHAGRIYRVIADRPERTSVAATPPFLGPAIAHDVSGIEATVRLGKLQANVIHEGKGINLKGIYAEPSFFDVFSFGLAAGDPQDALSGPNKIVLSNEAAARIFGEVNPMSQVIVLEDVGDFTVTGVVDTESTKSHLRFDMLASFATLETFNEGRARLEGEEDFWFFATYVLLDDDASADALEHYLARVSHRFEQWNGPRYSLRLQPLTSITLGPRLASEISTYSLPLFVILLLGGIGIVVMLAAGFNYIGLTVARSLQRAKEVGIRKTVGAHRRQIIFQILAESVVLALAALALAYVLLTELAPAFSSLSVLQTFAVDLEASAINEPHMLGVFIVFGFVVGLLAGLYPAFYLSKLSPVLVLKGAGLGRGHTRMRLRKVLVATQLIFSAVFIITGVLVYRQFDYMLHFDYGFQTEELINVDLQGTSYPKLRDELLRHPEVLDIAATSIPPASGARMKIETIGRSDTLRFLFYSADAHFLETMGLRLLAGNNISDARVREGIIVNEAATRQLSFASPQAAIGQDLYVGWHREYESIVGVVEDYQSNILLHPVEPLVLLNDPEAYRRALVRVHPGQMRQAVEQLERIWKQINPVHPIAYTFYDSQLRAENEGVQIFQDLMKIVGLASVIALAIACLGLLAMVAYQVEQRTKEVGIRKVLGASLSGLVWLLSREFVLLLPVVLTLALPLAWFGNTLWLSEFANRIPVEPFIVLISIVPLLIFGGLAIGTQAIRIALSDPVESLRYE